jgi:hypothetical protein
VPLDEDALAAIVAWVTIRAPWPGHLRLSVPAPASRRER